MSDYTTESLNYRISRLERDSSKLLRYQRVWGSSCALMLAIFVLTGQEAPPPKTLSLDTLTVQRINLVDSDGEPRGMLSCHKKGAGLYLKDERGKTRIGLASGSSVPPHVYVRGSNNKNRFEIWGDDEPAIFLHSGDRKATFAVKCYELNEGEGARLWLTDMGRAIWRSELWK